MGKVEEVKLISGKAVVKGKIQVSLLYRSSAGYEMEQAEQEVPFNQILDLDGIPEDSDCFAMVEMTGCTVMAAAGQEGGNTITVTAILHLRIYRKSECYLVNDAFSTQYQAQVTSKTILTEQLFRQINSDCEVRVEGSLPDEEAQVIHCFVEPNTPELVSTEQGLLLSGRANAHIVFMNSLGEIDCYDKTFEYCVPGEFPGSPERYRYECWCVVTAIEVQKSGKDIVIQPNIRVSGLVFERERQSVVDHVECTELLNPSDPDVALRIYYASQGENVFDIAKRYHVSPAAMMKSNQLDDLELAQNTRLLVPVTV